MALTALDAKFASNTKESSSGSMPQSCKEKLRSSENRREAEKKVREECRKNALAISEEFLVVCLRKIRELLNTDIEVTSKNDVAATSRSEIIHCYPGVACMVFQRVAYELHQLGYRMFLLGRSLS